MIVSSIGDIFAQPAHTIVNPVNCVGIMGRGLALEFKRRHPDAYRAYRYACDRGRVRPGRIFLFETSLDTPRCIAHFPTKRHWRDPSRLDDIRAGLIDLAEVVIEHAIPSIAIPPLGCGLGGLPWQDVAPLITSALSHLPVTVILLHPTSPRS